MKTTRLHPWFFVLFLFIIFLSCKKSKINQPTTTGNADIDALVKTNAPLNFNFNTSRDVQIDITILAPDDKPVKNIPVTILDKSQEAGGHILFVATTDHNGKIKGVVKLPSYYTKVAVDPGYIGIMRNATVNIVGNSITCTLGGINGYSGNIDPGDILGGKKAASVNFHTLATPYEYMGEYDKEGKPDYFEKTDDKISEELLSYINASLPESKPVPTYHPDYLKNSTEANINIKEESDVWFTFVHEGAGWKNSIAYFTYKTGSPPQSEKDIEKLHIILPNASLKGSGGALQSGNKVKLGRFPEGTSIGFALIANGWTGTQVGSGTHIDYTIDKLNPEADVNLKKHTVLLYDDKNKLFLVGIEDARRDQSCDNDFNDCIFYLTSNPVTAISQENVNPIDEPNDTDGDGVTDVYDKFPSDPTRAYINYYPGENTFGTLAFEDNWPNSGDYDLNDLIIDYRYTVINDAQNRTIEMNADFVVQAAGASFRNGFGVEFPFAASAVKSVEGGKLKSSEVAVLAANGCEEGQTKAVIIPFDDAFTLNPATGGAFFINTIPSNPHFDFDTIRMKIIFNTAIGQSDMGTAPYNSFLISNKIRGKEVHLPGYSPTKKANTTLFGTGNDNTSPTNNRYYKTKENLPYALLFNEKFNYPIEEAPINKPFLKFIEWAKSGGVNLTDWYKNSDNIDKAYIYKK